jgi:hypothetical protein
MKKPRRSGAKSAMWAAKKRRKLGPHRDNTTETVAQRAAMGLAPKSSSHPAHGPPEPQLTTHNRQSGIKIKPHAISPSVRLRCQSSRLQGVAR